MANTANMPMINIAARIVRNKPGRRKRNTIFLWMACFVLVLLNWSMTVSAVWGVPQGQEEVPVSMQDGIEQIDFQMLEEYKNQVDNELNGYLQGMSIKEWIVQFVRGTWELDWKETSNLLLRLFLKEVVANTHLLAQLLVLCVLAALLMNLQGAFSSDVAGISYLSCYLAMAALAIGSFKAVISIGHNTIDNMVAFMTGMLPQMLVLTAGLGHVQTSAMLFPVLMATATALGNAVKNIVFPLIILSAVVSLVNHMSQTIRLDRLGKFFTQMAQLALGFFLTLFVGIITLRALYAAVLDKVTLRASKFISDNAIPVIGKMFSDTIEVAAGYVVMLKQALGLVGVLLVLGMVLMPVIKIGALALIYKAAAAMAEPLGDSRTSAVLESMSAHLFLMLAAVLAVSLMFLIMIAIVAGMSNSWSMLP